MSGRPSARWWAYAPTVALLALPVLLPLFDGSVFAADAPATGAAVPGKPTMLEQLAPIGILLAVIGLVFLRLPRVDVGHSKAFIRRRVLNWLPLGLTYSFLYMGRYNLSVAKKAFGADVMDNDDFSTIFMVGTIVYGVSFIINGPLTDRYGGRATILISALGAALANLIMGLVTLSGATDNLTLVFTVLYAVNMYFQSFGAVSIVKVNAPWFHVRERGTFGAIFGILISLGIYFAYDWGQIIVDNLPLAWVFLLPACILVAFAALDFLFVRNNPSEAGFDDFDPGDSKVGADGPKLNVWQVVKLLFSQQVIVIIAFIEFCSGFLRQSIMQYMPFYAKATGYGDDFVFKHWGVFLCCAGILGGMVAGVLSDRLFDSRRGPVAALLYGVMLAGGILTLFTYDSSLIGPMAVILSMAIIGVHGMLSGTASMDFGGRKNTGVAVGIIDGFVYLGTGLMALVNGIMLPSAKSEASADPDAWMPLFAVMIPVALIGFILTLKIWNARARSPQASKST